MLRRTIRALGFLILLLLPQAVADPDSGVPRTQTVNLLGLIDPKLDVVEGEWMLKDGVLISSKQVFWARLQIPYEPPVAYDLTLELERKVGLEAINIGLVHADSQFHVVLDGWPPGMASGLATLDGKWANKNETTVRRPMFENGKRHTIICKVRRSGVSVSVDGKTVIDWNGDYGKLTNLRYLTVPNPKGLYISSVKCIYHFYKYELKPVRGRGKRVRSGPIPGGDPRE